MVILEADTLSLRRRRGVIKRRPLSLADDEELTKIKGKSLERMARYELNDRQFDDGL